MVRVTRPCYSESALLLARVASSNWMKLCAIKSQDPCKPSLMPCKSLIRSANQRPLVPGDHGGNVGQRPDGRLASRLGKAAGGVDLRAIDPAGN